MHCAESNTKQSIQSTQSTLVRRVKRPIQSEATVGQSKNTILADEKNEHKCTFKPAARV